MKTNKELIIALIVGFLLCIGLSAVFVFPVFKGKVLRQHDITQYVGSAQEAEAYKKSEHKEILWTNSMFSGMPTYVVTAHYTGNVFSSIHLFCKNILPHPASFIFLLLINFFILLVVMKVDPWTSLAGAVAFAFSTYFIVILAAGHNAKVDAIVWLPGIFAGLYMAYRRNIWLGAALFGFYMAIEISAGHPQMVYYFAFMAIAFVAVEFIGQIIEGKFLHFVKASALIGAVAALAVGANWSYLKTTNDYAKYSIRGPSELTSNAANKTSGLDRDYVTQWSNGVGETWTLLVPNFKGGSSADISGNKTAVGSVPAQQRQMLRGMDAYFGDQPSTGGPIYAGAGVFFLFLFSLFFVKDRLKWALFFAFTITVMMSWGKNFPAFTNFMLDYFPLYNKFRAVVSAMVIPELIIPILAFLGLGTIVADPDIMKKKATIFGFELPFSNQIVYFSVAGLLVFVLLLMYIMPGLFNSFFAAGEYESLMGQLQGLGADANLAGQILDSLETARIAIFKADVLRSLIYLILTAGIVALYFRFKFHRYILAAVIFIITTVDMVSVNRRYLNDKNFTEKKEMTTQPKRPADQAILQDPDINYRVANLAVSMFNDATTSYYHKSIGGYHGAKLKRYQELIENGISPELQSMYGVLQGGATPGKVDTMLRGLHVLNMLNTRYYILDPGSQPLRNPYALGNAWFPSQIKWVDNADGEMAELLQIDTRTTAVADKKFEAALAVSNLTADSTSTIRQTAYHPEKMEYESKTATEKIAVFSEIWYPEGWFCYIDGNEVPIGRVDYVLRAVKVPAGNHKIELVFQPRFHDDERISMIISLILLLAVLGLVAKVVVPYFKSPK